MQRNASRALDSSMFVVQIQGRALSQEVSFSSLEDHVLLVEKFKKYFGTGGIRSNEVFPPPRSASDIKEFLIARLGARLNMRPGQTLTDETQFEDLGINSLALVKFSLELEEVARY